MIGIIGSGPAGLLAAATLVKNGMGPVKILEKRLAPGRKLLVAGSSGLNVTFHEPLIDFIQKYQGGSKTFWQSVLEAYPPQSWLNYIHSLGTSTFLGSSDRYFIEDKKAARFLQSWTQSLLSSGVIFDFEKEVTHFECTQTQQRPQVVLHYSNGTQEHFDSVCFALGGGSWEPQEVPLRWPQFFIQNGITFNPFRPANVGYQVAWSTGFLQEAERLPLKRVTLRTSRGSCTGDALITSYGLEGTPVYTVGISGQATLDLRPDLTHEEILKLLKSVKENRSPYRRIQKNLSLCDAALALLYHHCPPGLKSNSDLKAWASAIKNFEIELLSPQPLSEAISSSGGISFDELDTGLMLKKFPGVFAAGEMLDWDAPTGGYLIQACVSQGHWAAIHLMQYLNC